MISATSSTGLVRMVSVREIILGLFFSVLGMGFGIKMVEDKFDAIDSVNWIKVDGEIITAKLTPTRNQRMRADFYYVYVVNQKRIVNSRIGFGPSGEASKLMEKYPLFSIVPVYYDPTDPEKSVVEPGFNGTWFDCLIPFALALYGFYLLFLNYKKYGQVER
jgi:hypothetical protein